MANLSFTTSGALPTSSSQLTNPQPLGGSPFSKALSGSLSGLSINPSGNVTTFPAPPSIPSPTTAVKSTTINNADGSSHVTTYHAPDTTGQTNVSAPVPSSNSQVYNDATKAAQSAAQAIGGSYTPQAGYISGTPSGGSTAPIVSSTATPTTFPGIVGSLASTSQTGSPNATTATTGLLNSQSENDALKGQAAEIGDNYGQQIAKVSNYGNALAGSYLNGAGLAPVSQGLAGQAQQTTAAEVQGLQAAESAALNPLDRELTAQSQAQSGLTSAGSTANTEQSNTQSGLTSAGTLAQPSATYPFVFDPTTGTYKNAANGAVMSASDAAQLLSSGKMSPDQALAAVSYLGQTAQSQLTSAMQQINPSFNWNTAVGQSTGAQAAAAAPGQAAASNIGTAGTAQTGAYNTVYSNATQAAATYSQQQSAINAIGNQALNLLTSTPGINPQNSQFLNTKLNDLGTQFSSPQYAAFNTAIQSLQARIGAALQAGEIPTAATQNAQAIASGSLTVGALAATLKQVDAEMSSFVGTQQTLADYAKGQMQTGGTASTAAASSNQTGGFTEGQTAAGGGLVYRDGKWVPSSS